MNNDATWITSFHLISEMKQVQRDSYCEWHIVNISVCHFLKTFQWQKRSAVKGFNSLCKALETKNVENNFFTKDTKGLLELK